MATPTTVAVIQLQWKRYVNEKALRDDLHRFMRLARSKNSTVALFPELTGLLLAAPLARELKDVLIRRSGILTRLFGALGGNPDLAEILPTLVSEHSELLIERYQALWSELAREYRMLVVGGTLLARDGEGAIGYRAGVFDEGGTFLGWQSKLHLTEEEGRVTEPGEGLTLFDGPFGRFGVIVGHDIMFPELVRALAYRGCVAILNPTLARSRDAWQRQRIVANARAQENQLFVAQSFMVGDNDLFADRTRQMLGRSAVLAPVEISSRGDGVLAEVGAETVEGLVTGEWNLTSLHHLWANGELPLREMGRGKLFHDLLAFDYRSGATIAERTDDVEGEKREAAGQPVGSAALLPPAQPPALTDEGEPPVTEEEPLEPGRTRPVIDPDTGLYLGESPSAEEEET